MRVDVGVEELSLVVGFGVPYSGGKWGVSVICNKVLDKGSHIWVRVERHGWTYCRHRFIEINESKRIQNW